MAANPYANIKIKDKTLLEQLFAGEGERPYAAVPFGQNPGVAPFRDVPLVAVSREGDVESIFESGSGPHGEAPYHLTGRELDEMGGTWSGDKFTTSKSFASGEGGTFQAPAEYSPAINRQPTRSAWVDLLPQMWMAAAGAMVGGAAAAGGETAAAGGTANTIMPAAVAESPGAVASLQAGGGATGSGLLSLQGLRDAATILTPVSSLLSTASGISASRRAGQAPIIQPPTPQPSFGGPNTIIASRGAVTEQLRRRGRAATIMTQPQSETLGA